MMRVSKILLAVLFGASLAAAQYRSGTNTLGGSTSFSIPEAGAKTIEISPSYGYSLNNIFMVGTDLIFVGAGNSQWYGIAPFVRGNFGLNEQAGVFTRVQQLFIFGDLDTDLSSTTFGIGGEAGLYYWLSKRFSIELTLASISLVNTSTDFDGTEVGDDTNFLGGLDLTGATVSAYFHF